MTTASGRRPAPRLWTLVGAHVAANLGFYLVLPFLASYAASLGVAPWAIGLLLGVRTFAQQGMFVAGGILSDRFGARGLIVIGCLVRVAGYLAFAVADSLSWLLVGAVLTGFGGALFSPALDALAAVGGSGGEERQGMSRLGWFAAIAVATEVGAVAGPLLGAVFIGHGFATVSVIGAATFVLLGAVLATALPGRVRPAGESVARRSIRWRTMLACLGERGFRRWACAYAAYLVCFNQLYLALPREIERVGGPESDIGVVFVLASVATILAQWPAVRCAHRWGRGRSVTVGLLLIGAGFVVMAVLATQAPGTGWSRLLPAGCWVLLMVAGQALLLPSVKAAVAESATEHDLGARYGALASCGGVAVLLASMPLGALLPLAAVTAPSAALPWLLPAVLCIAAVLVARRGGGQPPPGPEEDEIHATSRPASKSASTSPSISPSQGSNPSP